MPRVEQVQVALHKVTLLDGGLMWDAARKVLVVQLVGPVDGSSPAVEQAKTLARAAGNGLTLEHVRLLTDLLTRPVDGCGRLAAMGRPLRSAPGMAHGSVDPVDGGSATLNLTARPWCRSWCEMTDTTGEVQAWCGRPC
jgi:hypothetical protein